MDQIIKLTNRQLLAIVYILESSTLEDARKKARLSRGTLYAWLKDEAFKNELKRQRDEIVKESLAKLKGAITRAVDELIKLMECQKPELKRLICRDILDYAIRAVEIEDVEKRLEEIEEKMR